MRPLVERLRSLPRAARAQLYERLAATPGVLADVRYDWAGAWAREDQIVAPAELEANGLIVFTGRRGEGKTRAAVQLFNREILEGRATRPRIFAASEGDVDVAVVHGKESGIMACLHPDDRPEWIPSKGPAGVLRYRNGVEVVCFSAKAAEGAVSHQGDLDLYDDVAKWGPTGATAWFHARASCRIGYGCGIVATSRRGTRLLRRLLNGRMDGVLIRRFAVGVNAGNLTAKHAAQMAREFEDDDLARQDLLDEDVEGDPLADLDFSAMRVASLPRDLLAMAVWIDPSSSTASHSCEVGIVAVALARSGIVYGCTDRSKKMTAGEWPAVAWELFDECAASCSAVHFGVETNKGGNMGPELLRTNERIRRLSQGLPGVSVVEIRTVHTQDSKTDRADVVSQLAKQGRLKLLPGTSRLVSQLHSLGSGKKNDAADAFVHGVNDLALGKYTTGAEIMPEALGVYASSSVYAGAAPPPRVQVPPVARDGGNPFLIGANRDGGSPWG